MIKRVIQALNYEIPPQFCVWAMVLWWVLCPVGLLLNCCSIFNYTSILIVSTCNNLNTEDTRGFKWWDKQFSCPNIFYYNDCIYLILLSWQLLVKYKFFWISLLIESTKYDIRWSATFNNNLYCYEHYPIIYLSFKLWYSFYQWILLLTKIDETTVFSFLAIVL